MANRLYYSVFHAVSALLINDGHKVGTHKGAILIFGQHYVKEGTFPIEDAKLYSQLQTMREKGDYNCIYQTTEEMRPLIEPVREFISRVGQKLGKFRITFRNGGDFFIKIESGGFYLEKMT